MHDRFISAVEQYVTRRAIPVVHFESGQDKDAIAAAHRAKFTAREGVVLLGIAQEKVRSFKAQKQTGPGAKVRFECSRQWVAVKQFYFYVQDRDWGPAFVKISTYLPSPVKLCLNGHDWVKQQLRRQRVRFESLDNGFLSCTDPVALQTACDALGPADVQAFFDRWSHQLPWPLTIRERAAGYDHRLSICQLAIHLLSQIAQMRKIGQAFSHPEIPRIVDGELGA